MRDDARLRELARSAAEGDLDAAEAWFRELHGPLMSFLYLLGVQQDEIEDLAQDICLRMYRGLTGYDPQEPFMPWMRTIARNCVRNHWRDGGRRAQHQRRFQEYVAAQALQEPEDDDPSSVAVGALQKCLEHLPEQGSALIELRYGRGLNANQIGAEIRKSAVAIRKSLSRLYEALRRCVESSLSQTE